METINLKPNYEDQNVDLNKIIIPELLVRESVDSEKLTDLVNSIMEIGLINPITLLKTPDGLGLQAGYRRYLAFKKLKRKTIPARVFLSGIQAGNQIMLDENLIRDNINIVDEAFWLTRLQKVHKLSIKSLAQKIHKSETFVAERLKLVNMDEELLAYLKNEMISLGSVLILSKCKNLNDRNRFIEYVVENGATEKQVRSWVDSSNFDFKHNKDDFSESEFITNNQEKYIPPELFCDICEKKTNYMEAKFVRICPDCLKISKANLAPQPEISQG